MNIHEGNGKLTFMNFITGMVQDVQVKSPPRPIIQNVLLE